MNECLEQNGNCSQLCVNEYGSWRCDCAEGFKLADNKQDCQSEYCYNICILFIFFTDLADYSGISDYFDYQNSRKIYEQYVLIVGKVGISRKIYF